LPIFRLIDNYLEVQGSGFRGSGFRGSGFRVQRFRVQGSEVQGLEVPSFAFQAAEGRQGSRVWDSQRN
jgi:hypothetical protein